jgi:hypothetical protein
MNTASAGHRAADNRLVILTYGLVSGLLSPGFPNKIRYMYFIISRMLVTVSLLLFDLKSKQSSQIIIVTFVNTVAYRPVPRQ